MSNKTKLRCAVYTRKSSEEGLDQTFNSLDAQREACVAYITSQASLGWRLINEHYDDGGISGGTLERAGIQRMLQHIRDGKIDVVVVYKIDRLTRSLMDFAKLVDVFDGHSVSFVSVTQQFNTTTSMGRLTLNVLLSFAQFEREVTAERIRDKIAASKQKGMWMGGRIPMGYRGEDRSLVIDEPAADKVRHLFRRYVELGSISALKREVNASRMDQAADADADNTDKDLPASEAGRAGSVPLAKTAKPLSHGHLRHILSNPLYTGKLRHKDRIHEGKHEAIIEQDLFDQVQAMLSGKVVSGRSTRADRDIHLLTGLLFDETGDRLSPTHAVSHGKRYRYYISHRLRNDAEANKDGWRVAAAELERIVLQQAQAILTDQPMISRILERAAASTHQINSGLITASDIAGMLEQDIGSEARIQALRAIFTSITLSATGVRFVIDSQALIQRLLSIEGKARTDQMPPTIDDEDVAPSTIDLPITIKRRGIEMKIVVDSPSRREPDQTLIDLIARAHLYLNRLTDGSVSSIADLARTLSVHRADISRILPLAFLSPSITDAILTGRQPVDLTARTLSRLIDIPSSWADQAKVLGV